MRKLVRFFEWLYAQSLRIYPSNFRGKFGDEMQTVFSIAMRKAKTGNVLKLLAFFGREIRDLPMSIWREHLRSRKGIHVSQNNLAWKPLNTKELSAGLTLFVLPIFSPILKVIFGYKAVINNIGFFLNGSPHRTRHHHPGDQIRISPLVDSVFGCIHHNDCHVASGLSDMGFVLSKRAKIRSLRRQNPGGAHPIFCTIEWVFLAGAICVPFLVDPVLEDLAAHP